MLATIWRVTYGSDGLYTNQEVATLFDNIPEMKRRPKMLMHAQLGVSTNFLEGFFARPALKNVSR